MTEAIVVGGGIAGCSTAFYLASDGVEVLLLEQRELNALASGSNAGSLHAQIQYEPFASLGDAWARQFAPAVAFFIESIRLWMQVAGALGEDLEVARVGGVIVAADEKELRQIESKARFERAAGLEIHMLDRSALRRLAPYVSDRMVGGAHCPAEGKANALLAATAFADAAVRLGAEVMTGCRVTGISRQASGFTVHTTQGDHYARRLVNAAGVDAARIAALVGAQIDIEAHPIQLSVTEPVTPLVEHLVYAATEPLTLKQTRLGTVLIGGGWPAMMDRKVRPQVSIESLTRNLAVALDVVPSLASVNVVRSWAAIVNGTADWLPILGEIPGVPGFFMNYVPWMGFTGGPGGGRIVASLLQGREAPVDFDLKPFSPQ